MAFEDRIHEPTYPPQRARVAAQQVRRNLGDACASAGSEGRRIEIPQRCHFAPASQAVTGRDGNNDGIEGVGRSSLGHAVRTIDKWQQHTVGFNGFDVHALLLPFKFKTFFLMRQERGSNITPRGRLDGR
jgi:hypothetical protein